MTGIFISYANEDRQKAEVLAHALEQNGWSVWWDRKIPFGQSFDQVIEANLTSAKCVLVLWTKTSVESRWVRSEASEAAGRDVLIPVLFETDVKIPLEFRLLQAVNLCEWHAGAEHTDFQALLAQIGTMLGDTEHKQPTAAETREREPVPPPARTLPQNERSGRAKQLRHLLAFFILPTVLIGAVALALLGWHVPTRIRLDAVVDHVSFTLGGSETADVPEHAMNFRSLGIENFDQVAFKPRQLAVKATNVDQRVHALESIKETSTPAEVVLTGITGEQPLVTFESTGGARGTVGRMQAITAKPGTKITFTSKRGPLSDLTIRVDNQDLNTNVLPASDLLLSASRATIQGLGAGVRAVNSINLQVKLPEDSPFFRVEGSRRFFVVSATLNEQAQLSLVNQARIANIEFLKQSPDGAVATAFVADGEVRYPDHPQRPTRTLSASDFFGLGDLDQMWITYLRLNPEKAAMDLRMEGVAGRIERSSHAMKEDLRLTAFDALWNRAPVVVLLLITAWAASILFGMYKLYRNSLITQ